MERTVTKGYSAYLCKYRFGWALKRLEEQAQREAKAEKATATVIDLDTRRQQIKLAA